MNNGKNDIAIVVGNEADLIVMKDAAMFFEQVGVNYDTFIINSYLNAEKLVEFSKKAQYNGYRVIICGSGGATSLPGMVASYTALPVIGVPILRPNSISGLDSILSILQMPTGVPVATMAVNNSKNAAIFAIQILAMAHEAYNGLIQAYRKKLGDEIELKNEKLQKVELDDYINSLPKNIQYL